MLAGRQTVDALDVGAAFVRIIRDGADVVRLLVSVDARKILGGGFLR